MVENRILVVDDEEHIRKICREVLSREKYRVTTLGSGFEALDLAHRERFDVLLTDISMPGMDGLDLLKSFKEIQREITAIVMTGFGTVQNVVRCLHLGAHGFLVKPFSQKDLIQSVEDALERNRILRENTRLRLLVPLFEVGKTLLSELHLNALLDKVTEVSLNETHSDLASVILLESSGRPVLKSLARSGEGWPEKAYREAMEVMVRSVLGGKSPVIVTGSGVTDQRMRKMIGPLGIDAMVAMPLVSKDKVVGFLILCKKGSGRQFRQSEIDLISVLSGQAAIAIENAMLFEEVEKKNKKLQDHYFESVKALAQAIEEKDSVTGSHGDRLENYALSIADRFGLTEQEKISLRYASALHDIGKIGVSEAVLKKAGRLTPEEYAEMKTHPSRGGNILREVRFLDAVIPIIYYHHEQFDGNGYPEGLKGEAIPIGSRIVAVLDAFDAMTSDRPYRKRLSTEVAIRELKKYSGIQFDPNVVDAFVEVFQQSPQTA
jgi:response regulator RpfG family c-di-GMP phosphodiesterase